MNQIPVDVRADFRSNGTIVPIAYIFEGQTIFIQKILNIEKMNIPSGQLCWSFICTIKTEKNCATKEL